MERKEIIARISWSADASQDDRQTAGRLKKTRCGERERTVDGRGGTGEERKNEQGEKRKTGRRREALVEFVTN